MVNDTKTSFSSAMSLFGVIFQSASEATGKFSLAFAPVLPCGVVALSSLRQSGDMKLAAFWFSETASSELVAWVVSGFLSLLRWLCLLVASHPSSDVSLPTSVVLLSSSFSGLKEPIGIGRCCYLGSVFLWMSLLLVWWSGPSWISVVRGSGLGG